MYIINSHFYTLQEVAAQVDFDPEGALDGTNVDISFEFRATDETDVWLAALSILTDDDASVNQPYSFHMESLCFLEIQDKDNYKEKALRATIMQMMVGSTRERIITMTGRGPWNKFSLGPVPIEVAWEGMEETKEEDHSA